MLNKSELPSLKIHKNSIKAWKLTGFIWGWSLYLLPAFLMYLTFIDENFNHWYVLISTAIAGCLHLLFTIIFPKIRWKRWRYEVDEKGVDLQRGIIITKRTIIPINRIQHVDTEQGPIYRKYGLSSISLSTAATTHEIPALDVETANAMRNTISERVRKIKEDV